MVEYVQTTLPGVKPKRPGKCAECKTEGRKLYRCQGCFKRTCDDCGGENEEGDWFCDTCWAQDQA